MLRDKFKLADIITSRDTIMQFLISKGIDNKTAFHIMEDVRKGIKYAKGVPRNIKEEYLPELTTHNVPSWYIASCEKIKYLFPKAHATAYVMMS
ncbi:hypothetical protein FACS1894218_0460 [Bacilli bacterium]|nr:hypothetical protein FACS1894218_0460 [Bacilli bacterium]